MAQANPVRVSTRWWRWPLAGLSMVTAFLAHDVAMAGDAHAVHAAGDHDSRPHAHPPSRSATPHQRADAALAPTGSCLTPPCVPIPPTACAVGQTLIRPAAGDGGGLDPVSPVRITTFLPDHPPVRVIPPAIAGPTLPPAVRRALLQVYVI